MEFDGTDFVAVNAGIRTFRITPAGVVSAESGDVAAEPLDLELYIDDEGCGCRTRPSEPVTLWPFGVLAVLCLRRRQRPS